LPARDGHAFGPKSIYKSRRFEELAMIDPGRVLNEFYNLCVEARCDFDLYRSMFENDPKKTTLCVDYAPYFFNDFGRILTRFLVLHVCRLTDPAGSGSKSNLTTNYILGNLAWPSAVQVNLRQYNDQLMVFRAKVEPARSRRIAHTDLHSQMNRLGAMGTFTKGEDAKFFADLQSFFDVAYRHVFVASAPPIAIGSSTDACPQGHSRHEKAMLYDRCDQCTEVKRANDVLDFENLR
jgi:hypothetical protein